MAYLLTARTNAVNIGLLTTNREHKEMLFNNPRGGFSQYPPTKKEAVAAKVRKYGGYDSTPCPNCTPFQGHTAEGFLRYTATDRCVLCASMDSFDLFGILVHFAEFDGKTIAKTSRSFKEPIARDISPETLKLYNEAASVLFTEEVISGKVPRPRAPIRPSPDVPCYLRAEPCPTCGGPGVRTSAGRCYWCEKRKAQTSPRQKAIAAGLKWYTPENACPTCGEKAARRVDNGKCAGCEPDKPKTPRQKAIAAGLKWYEPTTPCKYCHTLAERRVDNGACSGCLPERTENDGRETMDTKLMKSSPDLVMSRELARETGFKVFRTGGPCRRGHKGFRYVSTGNCIDCLASN